MLQDKGVAQGGIVDTPDGRWYAYLFQDHGAVGRIPFLAPLAWDEGWPVVGVEGKVPETLDIPVAKGSLVGIVTSDEFDREPGDNTLPLAWQWNHNPDDRNWSLTKQPGRLRLTTGRVDDVVTQARNTLTQRAFGPECSGTTLLEVGGMKDGDCAGLIALQNQFGFVGVRMGAGAKSIVMVSAENSSPVEVMRVPLSQDHVFLRIECDFKDMVDTAYFFFSLDGNIWKSIGKPHRLRYDLVHFMGCRFGLFNYATHSEGGYVDFDFFRIDDRLTGSEQ
jgi:beta-xylosidase